MEPEFATPMTPAQRRDRSRLAAATRWAKPDSRQRQSEAARAAWYRKFEEQVDPEGTLAPAERAKLAKSAATAYMARLRLARGKS